MTTYVKQPENRTSNPAFSFGGLSRLTEADRAPDTVTIPGAALKSLILLGILMAVSVVIMANYLPLVKKGAPIPEGLIICMVVGLIGGLVMALWTMFVPRHAPVTAPIYAVLEGLAIGGISTAFEAAFPGIALQAMGITFAALFAILALYGTGIIKVTETFKAIVIGATLCVCLVYLAAIVLRLFSINFPYLHDTGPIGIGISAVICVIATLNFALDFQAIVDARDAGAPRWFEWYLGFGLLLTIVWLYLEVLRLLAKIRSND
jgi:uncharacterized YccA/Bax inhibitor family protein